MPAPGRAAAPARTSRTSCSSPPRGPALPWSGNTRRGPRPDGRSSGEKRASRSSPACAGRNQAGHGAEEPGQDHSWRDADRVTYVWDLSQTTGQPVPLPPPSPRRQGEAPPGLWDCLCWLARREGYAVEREHGCPDDGTTFWAARRIRIPPGLRRAQAVWALAHQLGHVLLHHTHSYPPGTTTSGCTGIRKAEADSVACIICARHGITPSTPFS